MEQKPIIDLVVMRKADMWNIHLLTDFTHVCAVCQEPVGIFPSGQAVLSRYRPGEVRIVCVVCTVPENYEIMLYANRELDR